MVAFTIISRCTDSRSSNFVTTFAILIYAQFMVLHTSGRYLPSCQTFCNKGSLVPAIAVHIWRFNIFRVLGICSREAGLVAALVSHRPPPQESEGKSNLDIKKAKKWSTLSRTMAQTTAYSRTLSPPCGCGAAFRQVRPTGVTLNNLTDRTLTASV